MDFEILSPRSEIDDQYQTPHEFCSPENNTEIFTLSNKLSDELSQEISVNDSEENIHFDENEFIEKNTKLEERLTDLKQQMTNLKHQLVEEKQAWQREIEEAMKIAKSVSIINNEEDNQKEFNSTSELTIDCIPLEPKFNEMAILDYEQKLAKYQEALVKAHVEKRQIVKRQLIANAYRQRLLEVEKLCNLELQKIKQNVEILQPLQVLASGWNHTSSAKENSSKFDDELTGNVSQLQHDSKTANSSGDVNKSEFLTMEDLENKIFKDLKDISSQIAATSCNPVLNKDDLMKNKSVSMSWYTNEFGPHSPFNPLM